MEKNYLIRIPNENMGYDDYGLYKIKKYKSDDKTILTHIIYINKKKIKEISVHLNRSGDYYKSIINKNMNGIKVILSAKIKDNSVEFRVTNNKHLYIKNIAFIGKIIDIYQLDDYILSFDLYKTSMESIAILDLEKGLITYYTMHVKKYNHNNFMIYLTNNEEVCFIFEVHYIKGCGYCIKKIITSSYILNVI